MPDDLSIMDQAGLPRSMVATARTSDGALTPRHQSVVRQIRAELVRPANMNAYLAGDLEGGVSGLFFSFDLLALLGVREALIVQATYTRESLANTTIRRRMLLHEGLPASLPAADNDPWPLKYANVATKCGHIDFASPVPTAEWGAGSDATQYSGVLSDPQGIVVSPATGILRAYPLLLDAYTPAANSVKSTLVLGVVA